MARIASGVSDRQAVTWIDLAEAPESKGHTLKIPARAGVPLWAEEREMQTSLDVSSAGHKATGNMAVC